MKKFEEALKELEEIVRALEAGNLPLETTLSKYEQAVELYKFCQKKLTEVEEKIEILHRKVAGELEGEPFNFKKPPEK
jgi:exodeoxyribonuclease VII small subunit